MTAADPVREQAQAILAMLFGNAAHALGDEVQGLVPRDWLEGLATVPLDAKHRLAQPVGVAVTAEPPRAPGTQASLAMQVFGMSDHLPGLPVLPVDRARAAPETDVADGGAGLDRACPR
jgi:hypothetical protein